MDFDAYLTHVTQQQQAMRAAAAAAGPDAAVPTCPGWSVHKLVEHIAKVHSWVRAALAADPDGSRPHPDAPPAGWDDLLTWWDEQSAAMVAELRAVGEDGPAWVFSSAVPSTAAFWARRQAHETAIHRLDAEHARGSAGQVVFEPELAADGVDEVLVMFASRLETGGRSGTIVCRADDVDRAWTVRIGPDGIRTERLEDGGGGDAAVRADAEQLYRWAWGRPNSVSVSGDAALLAVLRSP